MMTAIARLLMVKGIIPSPLRAIIVFVGQATTVMRARQKIHMSPPMVPTRLSSLGKSIAMMTTIIKLPMTKRTISVLVRTISIMAGKATTVVQAGTRLHFSRSDAVSLG